MATKGLIETRLVRELGGVNERGWTLIETDAAARAWEELLVQVVPLLAEAFAAERGPELARRTEPARAAARGYLDRINRLSKPADRAWSLRQIASPAVLAEAERLAEWPGVLQVAGAEDIYMLACLSIAMFDREVERDGRAWSGVDPLEDQQLMWRVQLVADELLCETRGLSQPTGADA